MNPKYKRNHDYSNYENNTDIFRKHPNMDNAKLKEIAITNREHIKSSKVNYNVSYKTEFDISRITDVIETLTGTLNSLKWGESCILNEDRFNYIINDLIQDYNNMKESLPLLKTNKEIEKEAKSISFSTNFTSYSDDDWDWDFDEESKSGKSL